MSVRRLSALAAAFCLSASAAFARKEPDRPNIVLVALDAVRADHVGCYGSVRRTTPRLDRLASQGVLFEDVTSQGHMTLLGFAALFASRYPEAIGEFVVGKESPLPESTVLLAQLLRRRGYRTGGFSAGGFISPHFGFARGFDHYEDLSARTRSMADTMSAALRWMAGHRDEPVFLFVHGNDAHAPYLTPAPYRHKFAAGRQPTLDALLEREGRNFVDLFNGMPPAPVPGNAKEAEVQVFRSDAVALDHLRAHYDGAIFLQDEWIGRLIDRLSAWGLSGRTVIVVTADHGEELGERARLGHRRYLYENILRIPLVIYDPRAGAGGRRVSAPVEQIDIAPTILALLGEPAAASFQGRSLVPLMTGAPDTPPVDRCLHSSTLDSTDRGWRKSIRCGDWKLIWTTGMEQSGYELYDLRNDPGETTDLAGARPDVALGLSGRMMSHLATLRLSPAEGAVDKELTPELRRTLEEAGYLDAGEPPAPGEGGAGGSDRPGSEGIPPLRPHGEKEDGGPR